MVVERLPLVLPVSVPAGSTLESGVAPGGLRFVVEPPFTAGGRAETVWVRVDGNRGTVVGGYERRAARL